MAKRKAPGRQQKRSAGRKTARKAATKATRARSAKPAKNARRSRKASAARAATTSRKKARKTAAPAKRASRPKKNAAKRQAKARVRAAQQPSKVPTRLNRERRTLEETHDTPPSSLDMNRRGSAARTGRAEVAEGLRETRGMSPSIAAGDADVDVENAYFTGDEAPGGDNPTPDQEVVDDIGRALGVEYQDNEELKGSDKLSDRDKHRWELDPASSEDYKERK